ncbi:LpxI family protein [Pseudahrensia aquimaris]|uniref:LpxI family protein n=1 Tax=Pseudahrensia aquimaris TaxID=744461 RepID=A0ABW3FKQ8_9HYPH
MTTAPSIAIIAGNGALPIEAASTLIDKGYKVLVLGIEGEADAELDKFDTVRLRWGQVGQLFATIEQRGINTVLLAGGIARKPDLKSIGRPDWATIRRLPDILASALVGDNSALSNVVSLLEKRGLTVVGFREVLPEFLAQLGDNSAARPRNRDIASLKHAADVAHSLGPFDIGQSVVAVGERVVAIEGAEGTDAMLERVAHLRTIGRLPKAGGVLVKCFKPGQEARVDLPTIGPTTIVNVHAAGLDGIGIDAGYSLIVERERTLKRARDLGVFVYGLDGVVP